MKEFAYGTTVPGEVEYSVAAEVERERTQGDTASAVSPRDSVLRLAFFCALFIAAAVLMGALISTGLRSVRTSSYGAWNRVMQGHVNADIVISGSSRAAYHYDPRAIEAATGLRAYNLGRAGTQTDVELAVLRAYLEHNRKPLLVVHNLDAFTFVMSREIYDPALYIPYLHDKEIYEPLHAIDPELYRSRYVPLYGYVVEDMDLNWVTGLKALAGVNPREDFYLGFSPRHKTWTDDFEKYKESHPNGVAFAIEPAGIRALRDLILTCRDNGIPLILVYSPEYREMQQMTSNRQAIFAEFHDLAAEYQVPIWDYSNWSYDGNRALFYNSQHLNADGASLFSDDFARKLSSYVLAHRIGSQRMAADLGAPSTGSKP